jgi:hypothetical protein
MLEITRRLRVLVEEISYIVRDDLSIGGLWENKSNKNVTGKTKNFWTEICLIDPRQLPQMMDIFLVRYEKERQ